MANKMYSSTENPILDGEKTTVEITPQARIGSPEEFSQYVGGDYIPIGIFHDSSADDEQNWIVHANAEYAYAQEVITERFSSKAAAIDFAEELYTEHSHTYPISVVTNKDGTVEDIYHGRAWMEYRVLQSKVNDGWVHGFHGDADHNTGGPKDDIIEGAKETVVENGYSRLLIEAKDGSIETIWPNCFLIKPPSPF